MRIILEKRIKYIENKVAKNIGLLYRAKLFLDKTRYLRYTICIFTLIYLCEFIVEQYKQNKSRKTAQSTRACSTNYRQ